MAILIQYYDIEGGRCCSKLDIPISHAVYHQTNLGAKRQKFLYLLMQCETRHNDSWGHRCFLYKSIIIVMRGSFNCLCSSSSELEQGCKIKVILVALAFSIVRATPSEVHNLILDHIPELTWLRADETRI